MFDGELPRPRGRTLIALALIALVVVMGIIRAIGRVLEWIAQWAMSVGDALVLILKWLVVGGVGLFVLLALVGLIQMVIDAQRRRAAQIQAISACKLPTGPVIRGELPSSPLHHELAEVFARGLQGEGGRAGGIKDRLIDAFRPDYARSLVRPVNAARVDGALVQPLHQMLIAGCQPLEQWLASSCTPRRKPMWLVRRMWNVITFGRLGGLGKGETTTRKTIAQMRENLDELRDHLWHESWPVLHWLDRLLYPQLQSSGESAELPRVTVIPGKSRQEEDLPTPQEDEPGVFDRPQQLPEHIDLEARERARQKREQEMRQAAVDVVEAIEVALAQPVPWLEPEAMLEDLGSALDEVIEDYPALRAAQDLKTWLRAAQAELPRARLWLEHRLDEPHESWPPLLREACQQTENSPQLPDDQFYQNLVGHAVRLYLTRQWDTSGDFGVSGEPTVSTAPRDFVGEVPAEGQRESASPPPQDPPVSPPSSPGPDERVEALF